jgi:hypothetical protein
MTQSKVDVTIVGAVQDVLIADVTSYWEVTLNSVTQTVLNTGAGTLASFTLDDGATYPGTLVAKRADDTAIGSPIAFDVVLSARTASSFVASGVSVAVTPI